MTSESDALLAAGKPITLRDGRVVPLRYGMLGLKQIEDDFGSLEEAMAFADALKEQKAKMFGPFINLIGAGLLEVDELTPGDRVKLLDPRRIKEYSAAMGGALAEALQQIGDDTPGNGGAPAESLPASPGAPATTSPPLSLVAATPSSGT